MKFRHPHVHVYSKWGAPIQFFQFKYCKICNKVKSRMVV